MATAKPRAQSRGDETRESLIAAAMQVFGRDGFHAASTRAIAEAAGCNQALIAYHFGSKEGLYLALFEHITAELSSRMGPPVEELESKLAALDPGQDADREAALVLLEGLVSTLTDVFLDYSSPAMIKLIMREQQDPTAAFDIFYGGVYHKTVGLLGRLVALVNGGVADDNSRLQGLTLFGQVLVFFIGPATATRVMGWKQVGRKELDKVRQQVVENLRAQYRGENRK
jgi:AcrR family transcriptional regulator